LVFGTHPLARRIPVAISHIADITSNVAYLKRILQGDLHVFPTSTPPASSIPESSFLHNVPTEFDIDETTVEPPSALIPPVVNSQRRSAKVKALNESGLRVTTAASAEVHLEPAQYHDAVVSDNAPE
jgi:hypothetical protein